MTHDTDRRRSISDAARLASLLERVGRQRDAQAFRVLFDHFAPRIRSFLMKRGVSAALADDLTQDVMLAIWRRASSFDAAKASAATWIYTIARNAHIDHYRKAVRARKIDEHDPHFQPPDQPLPDDLYERAEAGQSVAGALSGLPDDQRLVLELAFTEGLSHSEIAERLGLPLGTVKSRVRLAMNKMRQGLGEWK
ncbi:MAG: sigma-70 family RNA polymerase sigma factor [Pseudomonadota bacterium]|nr:sigma-70 family RNA polymerase sigma factor [Pseudomonadota bacterium]